MSTKVKKAKGGPKLSDVIDARASGAQMNMGSQYSGLFHTGCSDPREFVGEPSSRRVNTPSPMTHKANTVPRRSQSQLSERASMTLNSTALSVGAGGKPAKAMENMVIPDDDNLTGELPPGVPRLGLLNFDTKQKYTDGMMLLNSPRSVRACLRTGIPPRSLLDQPLEELVQEMKNIGEDTTDPEFVKLRFNYLCRRKRQYLQTVLEARDEIISEETVKSVSEGGPNRSPSRHSATSGGGNQEVSSMVYKEEKRLQKIVDNNASRMRQQLLHRELLRKQREKEDARIEQQQRQDERNREEAIQHMIEKSKKEEEAQRLRNEARELERRERAAQVELKRAMYEAKDEEVKQRIMEQRKEMEAANEAKRIHNVERRRQMKEHAEEVLAERRGEFQKRWEKFEADRKSFKLSQEEVREQRQKEAAKREETIQEAIERANQHLEYKIRRTVEREEAADLQRAKQEEERKERVKQQREYELCREVKRQAVYKDSQLQQQERVAKLTHRIRTSEEHLKRVQNQSFHQRKLAHELSRQKEIDKMFAVERSQVLGEERRRRLEESIEDKNSRIQRMKEQQEELKRRRKMHREEVERSRVKIEHPTPGPMDYVVKEESTAPKWKFGLPASAMGLRVVSKAHPAPAYEQSPGPCMYNTVANQFSSARIKTPAAFSFAKHDRFNAIETSAQSPGPADYSPPQSPDLSFS